MRSGPLYHDRTILCIRNADADALNAIPEICWDGDRNAVWGRSFVSDLGLKSVDNVEGNGMNNQQGGEMIW